MAVIRNLYASNVERSPMFKGGARGIVVNNFIANPGHTAIRYVLVDHEWGALPHQTGQMAIVGNVLHYGADTRAGLPLLTVDGVGPCEVFLDDNVALDTRGAAIPPVLGKLANVIPVVRRPLWPAGFVAHARRRRRGAHDARGWRAPLGPRSDRRAHHRAGAGRQGARHRQRRAGRRLPARGRDAASVRAGALGPGDDDAGADGRAGAPVAAWTRARPERASLLRRRQEHLPLAGPA